MLRLFYKACRLLTYIIIALGVIFILSKLLPVIGDVFNTVIKAIKSLMASGESLLKNITR